MRPTARKAQEFQCSQGRSVPFTPRRVARRSACSAGIFRNRLARRTRNRTRNGAEWAVSSAVEQVLYTHLVGGSIPSPPTTTITPSVESKGHPQRLGLGRPFVCSGLAIQNDTQNLSAQRVAFKVRHDKRAGHTTTATKKAATFGHATAFNHQPASPAWTKHQLANRRGIRCRTQIPKAIRPHKAARGAARFFNGSSV